MREIKFRAWNTVTKTMVDLYKITPLAVSFAQDGIFIPFSDHLILMQYTGLKDKNGQEIYEGDIILSPDLGCNGEVLYRQEVCAFELKVHDVSRFLNYTLDDVSKFEIIGNIYEHPELLKTNP